MGRLRAARPDILGGMFDALSGAMRIYPTAGLGRSPRKADFCRWGYAVPAVLGLGSQSFLDAYRSNVGEASEEAMTANSVAAAVVALLAVRKTRTGTAAELLGILDEVVVTEKTNRRSRNWPQAGDSLSAVVRSPTPPSVLAISSTDCCLAFTSAHYDGGANPLPLAGPVNIGQPDGCTTYFGSPEQFRGNPVKSRGGKPVRWQRSSQTVDKGLSGEDSFPPPSLTRVALGRCLSYVLTVTLNFFGLAQFIALVL